MTEETIACIESDIPYTSEIEENQCGSNTEELSCDLCDKTYAKRVDLVMHKKLHGEKFTCDVCGKTYNRKRNLKQHAKKHLVETSLTCNICEKEFKSFEEKCTHIKEDNGLKSLKKYTPEFKIDAVKKVKEIGLTNAAKELHLDRKTLHKWRRIIFKPLYCSFCGKTFAGNWNLKSHEQRHHPEVSVDAQNGDTIGEFTQEQKHTCDICQKNFKTNRNKEEHIRWVHEKEKNNVCEFCSKVFSKRNHLTNHIKAVHEKILDFACEFCEKKFSSLSQKTIHERKHTGVKPYHCEICGESCSLYKAKQAKYLCIHCNGALVPVKLKQVTELVESKGKDIKNKFQEPKNVAEKKTHLTNQNLQELYNKKYGTDEQDISEDGESTKLINDEYVKVEMEDTTQHEEMAEYKHLLKNVENSKLKEMIDNNHLVQNVLESNDEAVIDEHNFVEDTDLKTSNNEENIDDNRLIKNCIESNDEQIIDEHNFVLNMMEQNMEEIIDDNPLIQHVKEDVKESNIKDMMECNNLAQYVKSDLIDETHKVEIFSDQDIKQEKEEIDSNINQNEIESSDKIKIDEDASEDFTHEQRHACTICQKSFKSQRSKDEHIRWVHEKERNFCCEFCSKMFAKSSKLTDHVKAVHEKIRDFVCGFCDKNFAKKHSKTIHERLHTGERPYQCQNCGQSFKQKSEMTEHRSLHSQVKEFQCVECSKQFSSRERLYEHVYRNHRVFIHEFQCSMCGKQFKLNASLQKHMKYHLGINNVHIENQDIFSCTLCEKVFKYENNMKTHMKSHTEEKPQCIECGKQYASVRGLKEHVAIKHERKSKFKCQVCGKAFVKEKGLEVHILTHLKPNRCDICSQGYKSKSNLLKHIQKEHTQFN